MNRPDWKELERAVAFIEQTLSPSGAVVKSPDRIDDVFGTSREVDGSIRYTIGTVPVLITIECRDRGAVQDITWIEQVKTKKENLRASKTIVVSSSGFSDTARQMAALHAIELREFRELNSEDIASWCRVENVEWREDRTHLAFFVVVIHGELPQGLVEWVHGLKDSPMKKIFRAEGEAQRLSALDLLQRLLNQEPSAFGPRSTEKKRVRINVHSIQPLFICHDHAEHRVDHIVMDVDVWNQTSVSGTPKVIDYRAPNLPGVQSAEYPVSVSNGTASLVFTRSEISGSTTISLKFEHALPSASC